MTNKIVISGYYGFDNFGDDAILHVITSNLKNNLKKTGQKLEITAISNNPPKIANDFNVKSIYTFDFASITRTLIESDILVSGGGSLLQNATSTKSLIYYLSLMFLSKFLGKKVFVYAQGIGPIKGKIPVFLTKAVLKIVDKITVRDEKSQNLLKTWGIKSILTADPVWNIDTKAINTVPGRKDKSVGIQLREWSTLDNKKLLNLAEAIKTCFDPLKYRIVILPLQEGKDDNVSSNLKRILENNFQYSNVEIKAVKGIFAKINQLNSLDFLIGMRFHACLIAIKYGIPTLALGYDPKVKALAESSNIPHVDLEMLDKNILIEKINELKENSNSLRKKLITFSTQKANEARQTDDLLLKILLK